VSIAGTPPGPQ